MNIKAESVELEYYKPKHGNRFHCPYCGRFARFIDSHIEGSSNGNDLILTWSCSQCGYNKEGQW